MKFSPTSRICTRVHVVSECPPTYIDNTLMDCVHMFTVFASVQTVKLPQTSHQRLITAQRIIKVIEELLFVLRDATVISPGDTI